MEAAVSPITDLSINFLKERNIINSVPSLPLVEGTPYFGTLGREAPAVGFQYSNAVKWRTLDGKYFTQSGGAAKELWCLDEWPGGDLVIVEGELDAAAFRECGVFATSVPNGANDKPIKNSGSKFDYIVNAKEAIDRADRIIIATDNDRAGDMLFNELVQRLPPHKVWRVAYPEGCKDPNHILIKHGKQALLDALEGCVSIAIPGIRSANDFLPELIDYWENGPPGADKIGITAVDRLHSFCPGQFTILTGVPGHGKSSWLNWYLMQLAVQYDYTFGVWSAEMPVVMLQSLLASIKYNKPFRGPIGLTMEEVMEANEFIANHFFFMDPDLSDVKQIVNMATALKARNGINGMIIDPWNMVTASKEHENISVATEGKLRQFRNFARQYNVNTILVAHPYKFHATDRVPQGYDISGSAAFFNMADSGITISTSSPGKSMLTCWKAKFQHYGAIGGQEMVFDIHTGRYRDPGFEYIKEVQ